MVRGERGKGVIFVEQLTLDYYLKYADEEWRWIDGFEGMYQVSNKGRLKSFKKVSTGRILSNTNSKGDYLSVILDSRGANYSTRIHRLVAETFIGNIPTGYHVHHKDGNKQNNDVDNLEILSIKDHARETHEMYPHNYDGMNHYNKVIRPKRIRQYTKDGEFVAEYTNGHDASIATGVCQRNILQVANKTQYNDKGDYRKQAGGYVWRFADESEVMKCE